MSILGRRSDKPRRAVASSSDGTVSKARAAWPTLVKRGATVLVVSGIAVAGLAAFTASSTNGTGIALANQNALGIASTSATSATTSAADLIAQRNKQLADDDGAIEDAAQSAALQVRTQQLSQNAEVITTEADRLKNLSRFIWPTDGKVGSVFGMRMHPILHVYRMHDGDDIGGTCGQPIWAAQSGTVVKTASGYNGGSGNNVWIENGEINGVDVQSGYLHMKNYIVTVGEKVNQGDVIGYVGDTGLSTACHLHFSIKKDGKESNPMEYIGWNPQAAGAPTHN